MVGQLLTLKELSAYHIICTKGRNLSIRLKLPLSFMWRCNSWLHFLMCCLFTIDILDFIISLHFLYIWEKHQTLWIWMMKMNDFFQLLIAEGVWEGVSIRKITHFVIRENSIYFRMMKSKISKSTFFY